MRPEDPRANGEGAPSLPRDLDAVYRDYQAFVWRSLHHLGLPRENIDDALQDVFIVVHRRLGDYDGRTSLRSWLYGIARRVASEYRRGTRTAIRRLELVQDPDTRPSRDGRAREQLEAAQILESLLGVLDEDKRRTFLLAEVEGMTAPEIAVAEGTNVNTVYARLRAARLRFEKAVGRHEKRLRREEQPR